MAKRTGLGRGIGALIPTTDPAGPARPAAQQIQQQQAKQPKQHKGHSPDAGAL